MPEGRYPRAQPVEPCPSGYWMENTCDNCSAPLKTGTSMGDKNPLQRAQAGEQDIYANDILLLSNVLTAGPRNE
jgi:hypothetical protein